MSNPVILDAEATLQLYKRFLTDIPSPSVPRHWVQTLVDALDKVLDEYSDLALAFEPPDHEEVEFAEDEGWPPDEIEPYETSDEGETH